MPSRFRAYLRTLLSRRQPGFAAAVRLLKSSFCAFRKLSILTVNNAQKALLCLRQRYLGDALLVPACCAPTPRHILHSTPSGLLPSYIANIRLLCPIFQAMCPNALSAWISFTAPLHHHSRSWLALQSWLRSYSALAHPTCYWLVEAMQMASHARSYRWERNPRASLRTATLEGAPPVCIVPAQYWTIIAAYTPRRFLLGTSARRNTISTPLVHLRVSRG